MISYSLPGYIGGILMKNKIVRSATFEYGADADGRFTEIHERIYEDLAKGGVGAIITGMVAVDDDSRINGSMVKGNGQHFESDLRRINDRLQALDCPLIVQLSHCGVKSSVISDGGQPFGPSAISLPSGEVSRSMTKEHIARVVESFAVTALRCKRAGASGVQLHAAHGYGLCQFLSPYYNKRDDEYGGGITGRSRILMEVYDAVRAQVGAEYPIWVKINSRDMVEPGLTVEESLLVCSDLDKRGINAFEISGGVNEGPQSRSAQPVKSKDDEGYYAQSAVKLAKTLRAAIISVGGHRTPQSINTWLNISPVAAVSLSRPLISEPDLINIWKSDEQHKPRCISCNKCYQSPNGLACQAFANAHGE